MPLRDVVQDPRFRQDFEMYRRNYPEMGVIYAAMIEVLQERPTSGVVAMETFPDFRIYLTDPVDDTPAFNVMYSYDVNNIYLHAITTVKFL
ncbi:MAG: hypothetical protein JNJ78_14685 [Anaerolineae bacterium]|nr:hypothetical protein [Anaerolineae bacterium]